MSYNNLNNSSPKITQPKNIKIELMEHQKTLVYAMNYFESGERINASNVKHYNHVKDFTIETSLGILADRVGSGKSLAIISLINHNKYLKQKETNWFGSKLINVRTKKTINHQNINLLIVPHKIVPQWKEFFKLAPDISIDTYISAEDEKRYKEYNTVPKKDVILISCTKTQSFLTKYPKEKWCRIIIDEADSIKLPKRLRLNSSFIWLITATPKRLRFSYGKYLGSLIDDILPWIFDYITIKNDPEYIEQSIILPKPMRFSIQCETSKEFEIIQGFISTELMSMINAGNYNDALRQLNCNIGSDDNILRVVTNNIVDAINNKKLELKVEEKKKYRSIEEKRKKINRINRSIKRLNERYDSIKKKIYNMNEEICPICMCEFEIPTLLSCCNSMYCFECIAENTKTNNKCPYCRRKIYKKNFNVIKDNVNKKKEDKNKNKMNMLLNILDNRKDGKFLIFANYANTFKKIEENLNKNNITYGILMGKAKAIEKMIKDFADGKIRVLMLNAKYFGAGMNLQMATDIIIYHRFNRSLEEQVIGRAQRLGRKEQLKIFYLLHSVEQVIEVDENFEDQDYEKWLEEHSIIDNNNIELNIKKIEQEDIMNI